MPKNMKSEIAGLRHFLPESLVLLKFIFSFFLGFGALWVPLGSLLGPLEALLGGLWTQKLEKNCGFLRFLKMQLFGSLKLLMALLGSSCFFLGKSGPKMGFQNG